MKNGFLVVLLLVCCVGNSFAQIERDDAIFFDMADAFFKKYVVGNGVDYERLKEDPSELIEVLKIADNADLSPVEAQEKKAFYINVYNLTVIKSILLNYPIAQPTDVPGFFDKEKHKIAGEYMTLNHLENEIIRPVYKDPRIHFVLVCGAKGCPPITNFAYQAYRLDEQMDMQTKKALNDPNFIRYNSSNKQLQLSQIFEWYAEDFGKSNQRVISYLNEYRTQAIPPEARVTYYPYDWTLNSASTASTTSGARVAGTASVNDEVPPSRNTNALYLVSSLLGRGGFEIKIFNNLYFQGGRDTTGTATDRYTFFTITPQFLYGINKRLNVGFDLRLRSVYADFAEGSSPFQALAFRKTEVYRDEGGNTTGYSRIGISAFGPKVKYLPFRNVSNVSIQHTLYFPAGGDLVGNDDFSDNKDFIDFDGVGLLTQVFYDQSLGNGFSLFASSELFLENFFTKNLAPRAHVPVKAIVSYFKKKVTLYGIVDATARWIDPLNKNRHLRSFSPYAQVGTGVKYQLTPNFEIETLLTKFYATDLNSSFGKAATFNIGLRYTKAN